MEWLAAWPHLQVAIVLALVVVVFFGFVRERWPPDVVALSAVGLLLALGILSSGSDELAPAGTAARQQC